MDEKKEKNKKSIKQKINDWYKSKSTKSLVLMSIFLIVLPIGLGVGTGIAIDKFFIGKHTDYSEIDPNSLVDDQEEIMNRYYAAKNSGVDYSTVLRPSELVNVGYNLFSQQESSKTITKGLAYAAIVEQSIRAASIRNHNEYLEESISLSKMVTVASRTYMHEDTNIEYFKGESTSKETAKWNTTPTNYSSKEYSDLFGKTPKTPLIYIVSSKTVLSSKSVVNITESGYEIYLSLNATKSVVNYVKQMKSLSNLDDFPSFEKVETKFYLSKDLMIQKMEVSEKYYAKTKGLGTDIDANLTIVYEVGGNFTIPSLSQNIDYGVSA